MSIDKTDNIQNLAQQGSEINQEIKNLTRKLETIKSALRLHAQTHLTDSESANAIFDFTYDGTQVAQVRFPPSTINLSPSHIEKVISLIGKEEFDRLFTVRKQVITNTDQLENLDSNIAEILGDYITLKENTPRVSFK